MTEPRDVFRCDYCGQLTELAQGRIFWVETGSLPTGEVLNVPAVYCGTYCGKQATTTAGSGRG